MSMMKLDVPVGWIETTIAEVLQPLADGRTIHQGWSPKCEEVPADRSDWAVLKTTAVQEGRFLEGHNKRLPSHLVARSVLEVKEGDLLLTCAGPRSRCGVVCLVRSTRPHLMISGKIYRFRPRPDIVDPRFLEAFIRSYAIQVELDRMKTGINDSGLNLTQDRFRTLRVRYPSIHEQRRIVAKIEELFSDLDAGVAALERAKAKLKQYRASVLKSAVEGRLTEAWRAEHPDVEPASVLLERILIERRARWEADQLATYEAKGKTPPKNWKEKYKEPVAPDTEDLPELPEGWCWAAVDMLGDVAGGVTKGQKRKLDALLREVPYLRVANVQRGYLDLLEIKTIEVTPDELEELRLLPGDVLFNEGGDRDKLGRGWVWNAEIEDCIHQNHVFRLRLFAPELQPKFISFHGNSFGKNWFLKAGKQSVNLASINLSVLRRFPVPVPPHTEQAEIIRELESRLSVIDRALEGIATEIVRAARLRQSIMKRAFEGKLVPQDPNDEPASTLLARIDDGNGSNGSGKKERKRRRLPKEQTTLPFVDGGRV